MLQEPVRLTEGSADYKTLMYMLGVASEEKRDVSFAMDGNLDGPYIMVKVGESMWTWPLR